MKLRAYARLVRLPNLPTALADICLAGLVLFMRMKGGESEFPFVSFFLLLLCSACLYCGGMVWNDYFDVEQDKRERPSRPIPSGQVSTKEAAMLGWLLFAIALSLAWLVSTLSFWLAVSLVFAIFLYDGAAKRSWMGPISMGLCRFLNILLGLSMTGSTTELWHFHLAFVVGLYIVGVTWYARTEARQSHQLSLQGAGIVILASFILAAPLPLHWEPRPNSILFPYLLVAMGFFIGIPLIRGILRPSPRYVQAGVKRCLLGLIILDAVLATALAGTIGLLILILIIPSILLRRMNWLYAT